MPIERQILSRDEVTFEVRFAVGRVPRSVWIKVRGKDRLASDDAIEQVVQAVVERISKLEVVRSFNPDATDFRKLLAGQ